MPNKDVKHATRYSEVAYHLNHETVSEKANSSELKEELFAIDGKPLIIPRMADLLRDDVPWSAFGEE